MRYSVPLDWSAPVYMETFAETIFKPALRAAGLPVSEAVITDGHRTEVEGVRIHDFRHTAAPTWLSAQNADIRVVSEWLGHVDYTVTLTVYSELIKRESSAVENTAPEPKSVPKVVPVAGRAGWQFQVLHGANVVYSTSTHIQTSKFSDTFLCCGLYL